MTRLGPLVVIGIGYFASAAAYPFLPGPDLGEAGGLWRPMIALALPTAAAITFLLLKTLWNAIGRTEPAGVDDASQTIVFHAVIFLAAIHLIMMAALTDVLNARQWADRGVVI